MRVRREATRDVWVHKAGARTLIRPFGPPSPEGRRERLAPLPRERGWGEGPRAGTRDVWAREAAPVPSSAPTGHLLPRGEGTASPSPIGRGVGVRVRREATRDVWVHKAVPESAACPHPAQCPAHACPVRARFPAISLQRAGYPGRPACRRTAPAVAGAALAGAGGGADPAGGDAALAAIDPGRGARGGGEPGIPDSRRIRRARAGAQSRCRGRRPGHGDHALAPVRGAAGRPGQRCGAGAVGRLSGRRRCAQAVEPGRRAEQRVREVPGLAPRLAAALGRRRRPGRSAGAAVAAHRQRPRLPRAAHRPVPGPLRAP
ncbi:hypothetical protein NB723_002820 [Xanthomonas sacchari]|nr:hypothetical protein [Xanthomonas sacchari]